MSNETGDIWIVFNGEIWNYKALRKEFLEKGHRFRTNSDTETIIHAYEEYGVDCIAHLHGMFGLAIWDVTRRRLLLARDRVGKKPLYYTCVDGNLIFASEIKSLLCHPQVKRRADVQALADFLSVRYVPGPATLFANISKVLPGHLILCENGEFKEHCYWDFTFGKTEDHSVEDYIHGIRQHIHRAVEERMMADVPLGAMLSGGVDSSIITGIMSQLMNEPVKTFSVGFDVPGYSELPYARLVAQYFGTDHHDLIVKCSDLSAYWPLLTWHRDEPVSEPSDIGVYLVSKLAKQHVKVVLSGEGGDDLSSMLYLDTKIWLPDNLLMKGDKMTMAASLESRIPLLDYKLIEFAASIPSHIKVKPFKTKYLLKRAYADFLPESILTRKKMGFNVPISIWFRGEQRNLITRLLLSERARSRGFLSNEFVASLLSDHLEGRTQYGNQLFILASLELWFRVFIDNNRLEYPQMSVEQLLEEEESKVPTL